VGWLLALDAAFLAGAIIATSVVYRRLPAWLGLEESAARLAGLRLLLLAGGAAIALPFGIGLLRTIRRLALGMAESAIPKPGKGVDQGLAPRRTLIATLEIGLVVAVGVPLTLVTLPFVPPFGVAGVILAYLLILGIAFWRNASDLDRHARAGSELIVHVLAKQAHPDAGSFEVVRGLLPGLGMIVPLEVRPGSEADGLTLGDLNLRGRTGASVVGVSRDGQRTAEATAATRLQAGDMLAITGSENAIDLAAALMRARGTSSPPSATGASAPPVE
jgi:CPA2 family monovalent cation:H+ antiporter-2